MAEPYRDRDANAPQNPPNSVVNPRVRRAAFWSYLGPLLVLFVVVGGALVYWTNRPPQRELDDEQMSEARGTTGEQAPGRETPGGQNPDRRPDSAREEEKFRGVVTDQPITELGAALEPPAGEVAGRRIVVRDVDVIQSHGALNFWVQDGVAKVAVVAPEGSPAVANGQSVDVSGVVEPDGHGSVRIRASRVTVNQR
jgi:hypothetical protein